MEEDLKNTTEQVKKLSESVTIMQIAGRKLKIQELSIAAARNLLIKLNESLLKIQTEARNKKLDLSEDNLKPLFTQIGDIIFEEITEIFNFILSQKNEDFKPLDIDWVTNNFSIRLLKEFITIVLEQNEMTGIVPFFRSSVLESISGMVQTEIQKQKAKKKN